MVDASRISDKLGKFRCEGLEAVLLAGGNEIEFRDQTGELLKKLSLEETEKKIAA